MVAIASAAPVSFQNQIDPTIARAVAAAFCGWITTVLGCTTALACTTTSSSCSSCSSRPSPVFGASWGIFQKSFECFPCLAMSTPSRRPGCTIWSCTLGLALGWRGSPLLTCLLPPSWRCSSGWPWEDSSCTISTWSPRIRRPLSPWRKGGGRSNELLLANDPTSTIEGSRKTSKKCLVPDLGTGSSPLSLRAAHHCVVSLSPTLEFHSGVSTNSLPFVMFSVLWVGWLPILTHEFRGRYTTRQ